MSVELQAPSLEEGFEKLRRAADSIPPERRPPEMRLLLASEQQFRSTVGLSRAALEAERAGLPLEHTLSQHQWLQVGGRCAAAAASAYRAIPRTSSFNPFLPLLRPAGAGFPARLRSGH